MSDNNKLIKTVTDVKQSRQWLMKYSYGGNCSWIWMDLEEGDQKGDDIWSEF